MRIHYLQHVPFETLSNIAVWAEEKGYEIGATKLYDHHWWPEIDSFDLLVVLGGPMNIYEEKEFPWLRTEKQFIEKALRAGKTILGICLGAQLIADVLGARVTRNRCTEIGWFPIRKTSEASGGTAFDELPAVFPALHWHGDTFDIPSGAVRLAESEGCHNQAFAYGDNIIGLQFHLELSKASLEVMINNCSEEIKPARFIQPAEIMLSQSTHFAQADSIMRSLMDRLMTNCGKL